MEDSSVVVPDHVPTDWVEAAAVCTCPDPIPQVRADHKGAAATVCARCGLPVRIDFGAR
jgi:hypothetical protein